MPAVSYECLALSGIQGRAYQGSDVQWELCVSPCLVTCSLKNAYSKARRTCRMLACSSVHLDRTTHIRNVKQPMYNSSAISHSNNREAVSKTAPQTAVSSSNHAMLYTKVSKMLSKLSSLTRYPSIPLITTTSPLIPLSTLGHEGQQSLSTSLFEPI